MKSRIVLLSFILFVVNTVTTALGAKITVTAPNGGGVFGAGASTTITWETQGTVDSVKIHLTIDNGESWDLVETDIPNTGSYAWTVPDVTADSCKIRVRDVLPSGPSDMSDSVFRIIQIRQITVTAPNGGESLPVGTKQLITWTTYGIIDSVRVELSRDNGKSWMIFASKMANTGSFSFYVPDMVANSCKVKVSSASDTSISDISDASFSIFNPNIAIVNQLGIPQISALTSIGPNPCKTNLSINFSLARREQILAEIYSLKGRLIKRLANEMKKTGYYRVIWNGTDDSERQVSTGSYFVRLCIGDKVYTKIVTVIK